MTVEQEVNPAAVVGALSGLISSLESTLEPIFGSVMDATADQFDSLDDAIFPTVGRARESAHINLPGDGEDGPIDWSAADRLRQSITDQVGDVEGAASGAIQAVIATVHRLVDGILPDVPTILAKALELMGLLVGKEFESLAEVPELWAGLTDQIQAVSTEKRDAITSAIAEYLVGFHQKARDRDAEVSVTADSWLHTWLESGRTEPATTEDLYRQVSSIPWPFNRIIGFFLMLPAIHAYGAAANTGPLVKLAELSLIANLPTPLGPGPLAQLRRRQLAGEDWTRQEAKRTGMSPELFDLQYQLTQNFLTVDQIIERYRRTGSDDALEDLRIIGFEDADIAKLKELSLAVATPSDVVRFLMRDVFDATAVARGQLDTDFEQKYNEEQFRKAGVSKELALYYWRAHWTLPSPTQLFEFLHRDQLDIQGVRDALVQADYAPAYIDKYINVAYNVPGRIDVRRMWQTGVITDRADLVTRYRHMGYNADDAEILAQFTEALAKKSQDAEAERVRSPIAAAIMRSFAHNALSEQEAHAALVDLGYTDDTATSKLRQGVYDRERDRADRIRHSIGSQYTKGFIDRSEAASRLGSYGFEDPEIESLFSSWDLDRELAHDVDEKRHQKDLTKAEIISSYGERLLARDAAGGMLNALGYDPTEAESLLALEDVKRKKADDRLAEAAIHTQYVNQRIDDQEARASLAAIGYLPERIDHLLVRWTVEREEHAPHIPTAQLEKLLFQGIVPLEQLEDELRRRGYSERDVLWLGTLWGTDVSIAADKLQLQREQFQTREERLNRAQQGVQRRFESSLAQRQQLQTERLNAQSALLTERQAAQVARDAQNFANRQALQAKQIQAASDRLTAQITAAAKRAQDAIASREKLAAQQAQLRQQALAAQDARQARAIQAQADRLGRQIAAANARAQAADAARVALEDLRSTHAEHLVGVRAQLQEARDVRMNAQRISQEQRQEAQAVRRENRSAARQDIRAADAAAAKAALLAIQTQRDQLTAELNQRLAELEAQAAQVRLQQAAAQRLAAQQAIAANTPTSTFTDAVT